ncbi:MAG: diacylglycerol kinase family lipid kinase [Clostridia bacterium]|nr:diacylglycerol kinase family lipid kinase [Clostridia bacterium]
MKHIFILNPAAGKRGRADEFEQSIRAIATEKGIFFEIHHTDEVGDASVFVREYCLREPETVLRFYACGGDGTLGRVVSGAVGAANAEVAVVPIGTGNDFVRVLGKNEDFLDIAAQIEAEATPFDVLQWNDKYCVNMINIGFDGEVAARVSEGRGRVPGKLAYIYGVACEFFKMSKAKFRCVMDGVDMGERAVQLSLYAGGGFCGGGFHAAPYADLHDGLMDVCFVRPVSRLTLIRVIGSYRKGTYLLNENNRKYFEYYKCSDVRLAFDKPQRICVDGEIEVCDSLHLSVLPGAVRIVVPKGATSPYERVPESPYVQTVASPREELPV